MPRRSATYEMIPYDVVAWRAANGNLSQSDLAFAFGMTKQRVYRIERAGMVDKWFLLALRGYEYYHKVKRAAEEAAFIADPFAPQFKDR